MNSLRLILTAVRYHWDSQRSTPVNFWAAVLGMIVNNSLAVSGLWAMLFAGKPDGPQLTIFFLALNAIVTIAWGSVCFFLGGLHELASYVEDGALEPMLATPRHPLLLSAIATSLTAAFGDVVQGALVIVLLFFIAPVEIGLRCIAFSFVGIFSVMGLFIVCGSIPFWVKRGGGLAFLVMEINLSLSYYPSSKIFSGYARTLVYLTPALLVGILPMTAVDVGTWKSAAIAIAGAIAFFAISIQFFNVSLRRYQSSSYIMAR